MLVAAGLGVEWLDELAATLPPGQGSLEEALRWPAGSVETENLLDECPAPTSARQSSV